MNIKVVTIIGANGTMGRNIAAIFASFGNAKVNLVSRTLQKSIDAKEKAYLSVKAESIKNNMFPRDYDTLKECLIESDLIFEACAEDWNTKKEIHTKIARVLRKQDMDLESNSFKIVCTGTSGLSITGLAELYDDSYRSCFFGMHFFNPPYSMTLCELIPTKYSDDKIVSELYEYAEKCLRRTTVQTKDTPAFLGNRIGFQFINEALQLAEKYKCSGGIDYIDAILGPFTGRSMAPLATADFVGLDIHKAIVDNLYNNTNDYANITYRLPQFVNKLINGGKMGKKTGAGLYKTVVDDNGTKKRYVYDIVEENYRERINYSFPFIEKMIYEIKSGNYQKAFTILIDNRSIEAEICCNSLLKYILYSLNTAKNVAEDIHACDDVMATGFNWCPPLALMEAFGGVENFVRLCEERVEPSVLQQTNIGSLLIGVEKSKYDYRKFIKAKR